MKVLPLLTALAAWQYSCWRGCEAIHMRHEDKDTLAEGSQLNDRNAANIKVVEEAIQKIFDRNRETPPPAVNEAKYCWQRGNCDVESLQTLSSTLPGLVNAVQSRNGAQIAQSVFTVTSGLVALIPGGKIASPVLRLVGSLIGSIFGSSGRNEVDLQDVAQDIVTQIRSEIWGQAATSYANSAGADLRHALDEFKNLIASMESVEGSMAEGTAKRIISERTLNDAVNRVLDGSASIRHFALAMDTKLSSQETTQELLMQSMCTPQDSPHVQSPCTLFLYNSDWNSLIENDVENGVVLWPRGVTHIQSFGPFNDFRNAQKVPQTSLACRYNIDFPGNGIGGRRRFRSETYEPCLKRAELGPSCAKAFRDGSNPRILTHVNRFRGLIEQFRHVYFHQLNVFFLLSSHLTSEQDQRQLQHTMRFNTLQRRFETYSTERVCREGWERLRRLGNQNVLPRLLHFSPLSGEGEQNGGCVGEQLRFSRLVSFPHSKNAPWCATTNRFEIAAFDSIPWDDYNRIKFAAAVPA